jgi:hypothetical protein
MNTITIKLYNISSLVGTPLASLAKPSTFRIQPALLVSVARFDSLQEFVAKAHPRTGTDHPSQKGGFGDSHSVHSSWKRLAFNRFVPELFIKRGLRYNGPFAFSAKRRLRGVDAVIFAVRHPYLHLDPDEIVQNVGGRWLIDCLEYWTMIRSGVIWLRCEVKGLGRGHVGLRMRYAKRMAPRPGDHRFSQNRAADCSEGNGKGIKLFAGLFYLTRRRFLSNFRFLEVFGYLHKSRFAHLGLIIHHFLCS